MSVKDIKHNAPYLEKKIRNIIDIINYANILHLDTEGGWGTSRPFSYCKKFDKKKFKSIVICRKDGPIINQYKKINIE